MNIVLVDPIAATTNLTAGSMFRPRVPRVGSDLQSLRETKVVELARELAARGHRATVLFADRFLAGNERTIGDGVRVMPLETVLRVPFHPGLLPATPTLLGHPAVEEADVVQASEYHLPSTFLACLAAHERQVPVVVWQETFRRMRFPGSAYQRVYEATFGRYVRATARRFIPRTSNARPFLRALGICEGDIAPWIPTGVDVNAFTPRRPRISGEDFGWPSDARIVLLVARLHATKGIDVAVRVLKWVSRRRPDIRLVIRGSGPEEPALRRLAAELGVEDSIRFVPRRTREEMIDLYNLADLVLCTSRSDLLPFSLMEASACGRPCIATDVGAIRDIVVNRRTGIVTRDSQVESLGAAISSLIADDRLRAEWGGAARQRAEQQFAFPVIAEKLVQVYRDVAA